MLDLNKFKNQIILSVQGGYKTVHEWTSDEGEGDCINSFGMKNYNGNFCLNIDESNLIGTTILRHINSCNFSTLTERELSIIENRICWSQLEDKDCNIISTIEEEKQAEKVYLCDYDIFIYINGIELTEDDLREIFPNMQ